MRARGRRDANHSTIVDALRAAGCTVCDLGGVGSGCPDIMVGRGSATYLIEIKAPGGRPTPLQLDFMSKWRGGPLSFVESAEEALRIVGAVRHRSMFATKPI